MKPENSNPRKAGAGSRNRSPMRIPQIPMEWMDPMSWRLPSGKALAEFALQAGFLAPAPLMLRMMLGTPAFKHKREIARNPAPQVVVDQPGEEAPERPGAFRETR